MMTIQDKIDEVVSQVQDALKNAAIPEGDREIILNGVKELGFNWQESNAHGRAMNIMLGMVERKYVPQFAQMFIRECVQLKQFDELKAAEAEGCHYMFGLLPMPDYAMLVDLLMVQAISGGAGVYREEEDETSADEWNEALGIVNGTGERAGTDPDTDGDDAGTDQDGDPEADGKPDAVNAAEIVKSVNAEIEIVNRVPVLEVPKETGGAADEK